jgi:hypothetical protein
MSIPTPLLLPFVLLISVFLTACSDDDDPDLKVSARAISDTEITVDWKVDASDFELVRTGGVGAILDSYLTPSGSMIDSGLRSSKTYCYQLREIPNLLQSLEGPIETSNKACAKTFLCQDKPDCDNATTYTIGDEREPNNPIEQSTIASETLGDFFSPYYVSVRKGTVNDSTDIADYLRFLSRDDIPAAIYICAGITGCEFNNANGSIYQGQEIAIELLDSSGNLIDTTYQADPLNGNTLRYAMKKGERYYVVVKAVATLGSDFEYSLFITDERAKTYF